MEVVFDHLRSSAADDLSKDTEFFNALEAAFREGYKDMKPDSETSEETGETKEQSDLRTWRPKSAHRFAGAFLMPAETLRAKIGRHRKSMSWEELFDLKRIFSVSMQALTHLCKDLDIFSNTLFRRLFDEFARRGWRSQPYREPHAMKGEEPRRFERLCFRALAEGGISDARAAELLGCSIREFHRRMDEPPASATADGT